MDAKQLGIAEPSQSLLAGIFDWLDRFPGTNLEKGKFTLKNLVNYEVQVEQFNITVVQYLVRKATGYGKLGKPPTSLVWDRRPR